MEHVELELSISSISILCQKCFAFLTVLLDDILSMHDTWVMHDTSLLASSWAKPLSLLILPLALICVHPPS